MALNREEITEQIDKLKILIREKDVPFFDDNELKFYLERAAGDIDLAAYHCLIVKAEECSLNLSGLSLAESSAYWLRLASQYRPNASTVVKGG